MPRTSSRRPRAGSATTSAGDFLFEDKDSGIVEEIGKGVLDSGGHLTYLHHNEWILNDTYPKGVRRIQTPHLYHIKTNRRIDLGHFPSRRSTTASGAWTITRAPAATSAGSASTPHRAIRAGSFTSSTFKGW